MTKLSKVLLAGTVIAFAGGIALPVAAQDASAAPAVVKSGKTMKIKLYGEVSRVFGLVSDGTNKQVRQGQNANTASRMGIEGSGKIARDWSLRTRFEFELVGDTDLRVNGNQTGDRELFRIRHTDATVSHKRFGAVSIGLGDTASNGTSEVTLVPGGAAGHRGGTLHHMAQRVGVIQTVSGNPLETISHYFDGLDGAGRATRMRYDSPVFMGAKASMSYIDGASWDAALRYSGSFGGTKIQGAIGFAMIRKKPGSFGGVEVERMGENIKNTGTDLLSGSFSVRTPMGLGVTVAAARQWWQVRPHIDSRPSWNVNPSLWYTMKATELGPTTVEYAFQRSVDVFGRDFDGNAHAVTLFQVLENAGTDTFLTFRYYQPEVSVELDPVWVIGGGFRARF